MILTILTSGKGLWSNVARPVEIEKIEVTEYDIRVYFSNWNVKEDGLIYTDPLFIKELNTRLSKWRVSELCYTEQGMQGSDYVSLEASNPDEEVSVKSAIEAIRWPNLKPFSELNRIDYYSSQVASGVSLERNKEITGLLAKAGLVFTDSVCVGSFEEHDYKLCYRDITGRLRAELTWRNGQIIYPELSFSALIIAGVQAFTLECHSLRNEYVTSTQIKKVVTYLRKALKTLPRSL